MDLDSKVLLSIFSAEEWMLVFNKLIKKDAFNVLENIINSSPYFRHLLEAERTTILFPKVFEQLAVNYENKTCIVYQEELRKLSPTENEEWNDYLNSLPFEGGRPHDMSLSDDELDDNDETPTISNKQKYSRYLTSGWEFPAKNASVLKLRLVCKTWAKGVNQFYQNLPYFYNLNYDILEGTTNCKKFNGSDEMWSTALFTRKNFHTAVHFLKHFDSTHFNMESGSKNPFVGRAISMKQLSSSTQGLHQSYRNFRYFDRLPSVKDPMFWNAITKILQKYGDHIWYCDLSIQNKFQSLALYYRQIREWILLMPNLKVLHMSYPFKRYVPTYPTTQELKRLEEEVKTNPLPKLKNLQCLITTKLPAPIFNELVKQNDTTLEVVQVTKAKGQRNGGYFKISSKSAHLHKLKSLSVELFSETEFNILMLNSTGKWNLEKLYFDYDKTGEFIEWSKFFKLIQDKFGNEVNNLMISLPVAQTEKQKDKIIREAVSYRLNMPLVKRLKLVIGNQAPVDFILPMKNNLEILELYLDYRVSIQDRDQINRITKPTIEFVGFENSFMESNIWEIFPKLKCIYVDNNDTYKPSTSHLKRKYEKWERKKITMRQKKENEKSDGATEGWEEGTP